MLGGIVLSLSLERCSTPRTRGWLLPGALVLVTPLIAAATRAWAVVAVATVVLGIIVHEVVERVSPEGVAGTTAATRGSTGSPTAG